MPSPTPWRQSHAVGIKASLKAFSTRNVIKKFRIKKAFFIRLTFGSTISVLWMERGGKTVVYCMITSFSHTVHIVSTEKATRVQVCVCLLQHFMQF